MIDQFINFVIRPPRAEYDPDQYLWEKEFSLSDRQCIRKDLELTNLRGHTLRCSHYIPLSFVEDASLPCVIYCHGNSGCRADANEAVRVLLPLNITVFTLDFSGSGLSDGDHVSLGWHEKDDLKIVVSYLRACKQISSIGLWGRSMGAVTSLLYGAEDPSIAGMVLDSAFSNLFDLMMELVDVYKIRLPKFTIKVAVQYIRRAIRKKARFDIMDLNCLKVAPKTFIPALFGHASGDKFIQPRHCDLIFKSYAGDKNTIKFDGDHNSTRPQFYYDSVSIFFYNVLHPAQVSSAYTSKLEKYYNLGDLKFGPCMDKGLLYEIISGIHSTCIDVGSSSCPPPDSLKMKPVDEILSAIIPGTDIDPPFIQDNGHDTDKSNKFQGKSSERTEESFSCTSSDRESWGRCSSLGDTDDGIPTDYIAGDNSHQVIPAEQTCVDVVATHLSPADEKKKKNKRSDVELKKPKLDKLEKLEGFRKRLRHCVIKRISRRRHCSS